MNDFFTSIWTWIKANLIISIVIVLTLVFVLFPKEIKKLFGHRPRRRRKAAVISYSRRRRTLPRSVGVRKQYTRGGKAKKPWQIKGSEAARRHMAKIRRLR